VAVELAVPTTNHAVTLVERGQRLVGALGPDTALSDALATDRQLGGLAALARSARLDLAEQNAIAACRVRAQHRAGTQLRLLASQPRPTRAKRPRGGSKLLRPQLPPGVLASHGISGAESSSWQAIASLSLDQVERKLAELQTSGEEIPTKAFVAFRRAAMRDRSTWITITPSERRLRSALMCLGHVTGLRTVTERA
jgi:hypothetical protein